VAFVVGKASLGPTSECYGVSFELSFRQCSIFLHISAKGRIMGPLEAAVPRCAVLSASQKKETGFTEPPRGQQALENGCWPTLPRRCGNVCICLVHTTSNTRCPKDISKGKAILVQGLDRPLRVPKF
jgi:hypothetical protein